MNPSNGYRGFWKNHCISDWLRNTEADQRCSSRCSANVTNADRRWSPPNLPFQEWTEVLGSERLTGALLDRLTHHVHILEMNADSYRLKQSRLKRNSSSVTLQRPFYPAYP